MQNGSVGGTNKSAPLPPFRPARCNTFISKVNEGAHPTDRESAPLRKHKQLRRRDRGKTTREDARGKIPSLSLARSPCKTTEGRRYSSVRNEIRPSAFATYLLGARSRQDFRLPPKSCLLIARRQVAKLRNSEARGSREGMLAFRWELNWPAITRERGGPVFRGQDRSATFRRAVPRRRNFPQRCVACPRAPGEGASHSVSWLDDLRNEY